VTCYRTEDELGRFGPGLLRFFAHFVLFYHPNGFSQHTHMNDLDSMKQDILLFYWMHLFKSCTHYNNAKIELITSYSSKLSKDQQIRYLFYYFLLIKLLFE
jgi:hypothetical protein